MKREAYRLANEIKTDFSADRERLMDRPEDMEMKKYEQTVLCEVRKEKKAAGRRIGRKTAAACAAAALLAGTAVFGREAHATLRQITWSIENALGLSGDLADYRDVIHTSVSDQGYEVTLQEAVVSEESLTVNYTIRREDGQPMEQYLTPVETLYVNGKQPGGGARGSADFLDEAQTVLGVEMTYDIPEADLSAENDFRIRIERLGMDGGVKGNWDFAFRADGAALTADTRRIPIGQEFTLPDGVTVTLEELTMNRLEQRITFRQSGPTSYLVQVIAKDAAGHQVEFGLRSSDAKSGYLSNEEIIDDGRIEEDAGEVTMTLNAVELPEESGRISNDYEQVGEPFVLKVQ